MVLCLYIQRYSKTEHTLEVDEMSINVSLYDTAGQEEYDKLRISYLKNKKPDVLVYATLPIILCLIKILNQNGFLNLKTVLR